MPRRGRASRDREVEVVGSRLSPRAFDEAVAELLEAASRGDRRRVHFATVHSVVEASRDWRVRRAFDTASAVYTDGMPLVWIARLRGARGAQRVCGPDVMAAIADRGRKSGLRHYFYGGQPGVADALATSLRTRYPGLSIAGTFSPPFRRVDQQEPPELIEEINASGADVLWVGLGSPKQELWAANHERLLTATLVLPVGAAFDFHSGRVRRAPGWIQRLGLEWIYRLATNPRRLLRRYLDTNVAFLWMLTTDGLHAVRSRLASGRR